MQKTLPYLFLLRESNWTFWTVMYGTHLCVYETRLCIYGWDVHLRWEIHMILSDINKRKKFMLQEKLSP